MYFFYIPALYKMIIYGIGKGKKYIMYIEHLKAA